MVRLKLTMAAAMLRVAGALALMVAAYSTAHAQIPCPPAPLCIDGTCGTGICAVSSGGYDVRAYLPSLPPEFATLALPAPPRITSQAIVRTTAEFNASKSIAGRRTIVAPGVTIAVSRPDLATNDTEVVLQGSLRCPDDSHFYWLAEGLTRHRLIGAGGQLLCQFGGEGATDVMIYGVNMVSPSTRAANGGENTSWRLNRLAILNSTFDSYRYALFLMGDPRDVIIANSSFISGGGMSIHRVGGMQRGVYLDNRFAARPDGANTFRQHEGGRNIYVQRNVFEVNGPRFTPTAGVAHSLIIVGVWFLNNRIYQPVGGGLSTSVQFHDPDFSCPGYPCLQNLTVRDNEIWTEAGRLTYTNENQPTWSFSNNRVNPRIAAVPAWQRQPFAALPADYVALP